MQSDLLTRDNNATLRILSASKLVAKSQPGESAALNPSPVVASLSDWRPGNESTPLEGQCSSLRTLAWPRTRPEALQVNSLSFTTSTRHPRGPHQIPGPRGSEPSTHGEQELHVTLHKPHADSRLSRSTDSNSTAFLLAEETKSVRPSRR